MSWLTERSVRRERRMAKVVHVSNDLREAFYVNGEMVCQCEAYELNVILKTVGAALGFDYEYREDYDLEEFPETLEG